jgi:DNA polymerase-4
MTPTTEPVPYSRSRPPLRRRRPPRDVFLVDLDAFFVSVERLRDPSLRGRPVIVGGKPGERGVVACASYEARAHGVHAGMPLVQAVALLPREETVYLHGDHAAYARASARVMEVLSRFTPQVEAISLDEAFLDLTGCERHHASCLQAAEAIHRAVRETTGLSVSIGVGGTRAVASIAASLAKPGGVMEVVRGEEATFLSALPIEHLPGVGPAMRRDLARFNLHAVGDLARIPEDVLEETFGAVGVSLSRRARGLAAPEDETPIGERRPKSRSISRETSFDHDTADRDFLDGMFSYLAQRASRALREEGLLAPSVAVRLRYTDFKTVEARRRLPRPTDGDDEILAAVRSLWPRRWDRRVKLRLVGVALHDLVPAGDRQLDLFDAAATGPDGSSRLTSGIGARLDAAVDLVRDRHGFGALVRGRAIDLLPRLPRSPTGFRLRTPACSA